MPSVLNVLNVAAYRFVALDELPALRDTVLQRHLLVGVLEAAP